jgi:hypothetical protein
MKPSEVSAKLNQIASAIENARNPRADLVAQDITLLADIVAGKKKKKDTHDYTFKPNSKKVKDKKGHFPVDSESQARDALGRANQYKKSPPWYDGSLQELVDAVVRKVHGKYPDIEISEASKKPGKGKGKKKKSSIEPAEVSHVLNQIATAIDNSRNPRVDLVTEDLKRVIAAVGAGLADRLNADGVEGEELDVAPAGLFKDGQDVTSQYPDLKVYLDAHPEGVDRGGYVVIAESSDDQAVYDPNVGWY